MEVVAAQLDFLGLNVSFGDVLSAEPRNSPMQGAVHPCTSTTATNTTITPEALDWGPKFIWERYGTLFSITEDDMSSREINSLKADNVIPTG